jgi:hypothetical protein
VAKVFRPQQAVDRFVEFPLLAGFSPQSVINRMFSLHQRLMTAFVFPSPPRPRFCLPRFGLLGFGFEGNETTRKKVSKAENFHMLGIAERGLISFLFSLFIVWKIV